jgi:hypothetical protein
VKIQTIWCTVKNSKIYNFQTLGYLFTHFVKKINNFSLKKHQVLEEYEVRPDQLVGQGYDGAAVMSGAQNGLQQLMKEKYTLAKYIHCVAHRLNLVISDIFKDALLSNCRIFIATLEGFPSYFSSPRRVVVLMLFTKKRLPANCKTRLVILTH